MSERASVAYKPGCFVVSFGVVLIMSEPSTHKSHHNRNPQGKNQYPECPPRGDADLERLLRDYHRRGITSRIKLSELFKAIHGITISPAGISRRRKDLGLTGSMLTTRQLSSTQKRQLVLDQLAKDPTRRQGPRTIREGILRDTGIMLTRDYVASEMRIHDPEGFDLRKPVWKTQNLS